MLLFVIIVRLCLDDRYVRYNELLNLTMNGKTIVMKFYSRILVFFSLLFLVTACDIFQINNSKNLPSLTQTQGSPESLLTKADQATDQEVAAQYRLIAADKYIQANQLAKAQDILTALPSTLTETQRMITSLLKADIAFNKKDIEGALKLLTSATFYRLDEQDQALQTRVRLLKANAFETSGNPLQALRERSYISSFLTGTEATNNQNHIWQLAIAIPLEALSSAADSGETGGWLQLAKIVKTSSNLADRKKNIADWMAANPNHPATLNPPEDLVTIQNVTSETYTKIALLLPEQQTYFQAVQNGIMAAYYQSPNKDKITIKTYTSKDYSNLDNFYAQAQKEGIQLIIGPFEKSLVNTLSQKQALPITTLAINYADTKSHPAQLYQFGLLPEDEAREVANKAFADGKRNAVAIVPQGAWGKKVLDAFRTQWEAQGGVLKGIQYIDRPVDLDGQVVSLVRQLPNAKAEDGSNMVFMVANPPIARQIKSLLTYHDLKNLPVYATSHIHAAAPDASQDNDLDGVLFTEVPWLLTESNPIQQSIIAQWPQAKTTLARLYALGVDIWTISDKLAELKISSVNGLSGSLSLDSNQRVVRTLPWATFEKGLLKPLDTANETAITANQTPQK